MQVDAEITLAHMQVDAKITFEGLCSGKYLSQKGNYLSASLPILTPSLCSQYDPQQYLLMASQISEMKALLQGRWDTTAASVAEAEKLKQKERRDEGERFHSRRTSEIAGTQRDVSSWP